MLTRLLKEEAGVAMGLAVVLVVLIAVMGAGLLTFVSTDLMTVVETNQGQRALETAEAGVQAAKRHLITNTTPTSAWLTGMRVNLDAGYADVTILQTGFAPPVYRVVSDGHVGPARRKIEAKFRATSTVSMPKVYLSRTNLVMSGSGNPTGASFFSMGTASRTGAFALMGNDGVYGRWADTGVGSGPYPNTFGSYPNSYNQTARGVNFAGVGALGTISGFSTAEQGVRYYGSNTCPYAVRDFATSPKPTGAPAACTTRIAFPFKVLSDAEDRQELERLRQKALALERANPGTTYYFDANPGDGNNNGGRGNGPFSVTDWPSGADYDTVRFVAYSSYDSTNAVTYQVSTAPCGPSAPRGVIVVENGNVTFDGNRGFNGGVVVRAYNGSGDSVEDRGRFFGAGTSCLRGWANSSGTLTIQGSIDLGDAPDLGSTPSFRSVELLSWRELYE